MEAESRLYAVLQQLDSMGFKRILVDPIPNSPEWDTLRDRLNRAQTRNP